MEVTAESIDKKTIDSSAPSTIPRLLDSYDLSMITGVPEPYMNKYCNAKRGPKFVQIGSHRRWTPESVLKWLKELSQQNNTEAA